MTSFRAGVWAIALRKTVKAVPWGIAIAIAITTLIFQFSCLAPKPNKVRKGIPLVPVKNTGELFKKTKETNFVVESLRGVATISVSSAGEDFKVTEIILAKRPGFLRLESLGPLGQTILFLATNNKRIYIYSPMENRFYFGLASKKNLSMIIPLPFKSTDIVEIIQGKIDLSKYFPLKMSFDLQNEQYHLTLSPEDRSRGMAFLTVDARTFYTTEMKLYDRGNNLIIDGRFSKFRKVGKHIFPMKLKYRVPKNSVFVNIEINYDEIKLNTPIEESRFSMTPPRGVTEIDIDKAIINFDRTPVN